MQERRNWAEQEVRMLVDDYLDMLAKELRGQPYNKTTHRQRLMSSLDQRTAPSIERKHQNVSAVLNEQRMPFIDGYKPLHNYQQLLAEVVLERLGNADQIYEIADRVSASVPSVMDAATWADPSREVEPPDPSLGSSTTKRFGSVGRNIDYTLRDALNRELGARGEQFVLELERRRLTQIGRAELASRVEWSSRERGDGLGYDVASFDKTGRPVFVEVKTTNLGLRFPFIATRNEVAVSRELDRAYRLYRLFHFSKDARFFILHGALDRSLHARTPIVCCEVLGVRSHSSDQL